MPPRRRPPARRLDRGATVCVTGGLGFVGAALCLELRRRGYEVVAADRLSGAYPAGGGLEAAPRLEEAGVRVAVVDVAGAEFARLARGADAIVHLAALSGV